MVKYQYKKYNSLKDFTYHENGTTQGGIFASGFDYSKTITVYPEKAFDAKNGKYYVVGSAQVKSYEDIFLDASRGLNWYSPERTFTEENRGEYWYYESVIRWTHRTLDGPWGQVYNVGRTFVGYVRGGYVTTVEAEDGTYPTDGMHTDGFWYIKSSEINEPPTIPTVIIPNGGETIATETQIKWYGSTDSNGNSVSYQIELSRDNGSKWEQIADKVKGTSLNYNFEGIPNTSTAKIRIRSFDGLAYSEWDSSDGVFTIQYNYAPKPPYGLTPGTGTIIDRNKTTRFQWVFSDNNQDIGDYQNKYELRWRVVDTTNWNIISEFTQRTYLDIPAGTFPEGEIEWQVKSSDSANLFSSWSNLETFIAGAKPEQPIFAYPKQNEIVYEAVPVFQWTSTIQTAFRLLLYDEGNFIIWDSEEINSINKAITCGITLEDQKLYKVGLTVQNTEGFWSDEIIIQFTTLYSPPPKPTANIQGAGESIVIETINATPSIPETTANEIYKLIDDEWVKIAKDIPVNGVFVDYSARSKKVETYKIKAIGSNQGINFSKEITASTSFAGVYIHDTQDPEMTIGHFKFDGSGRSTNWARQYHLLNVSGRKLPIVEFSDFEEKQVNVSLQILEQSQMDKLESLVTSKNTLCYRDGRGRLFFGFIPQLSISDEPYGHAVDFTFIKIDYKGGV